MNLTVNGCSFTNGNFGTGSETWANVVRNYFKKYSIKYENLGWKGNSNDNIIPQTLNYVRQLEKNEKTIIVMQLTALDRIIVKGKKSPTIGSALKSLNWMQWGMSRNEPIDNWWKNYFINEYSEEKHIKSFIEKLLNFQFELKEHPNIKYKIFCGWDILTQNNDKFNMWDLNIKYQNKQDKLISELYPELHEKFKLLDLSKFWFFENDYIHYGGLSQWVQYNVPTKHWYRDTSKKEIDYHPSDFAHKEFAEQIIIPLIKEML
jgi:hypothetical protein